MIHLMELPNPDPITGRPEHGGRDRHACVAIKSVEPLKRAFEKAGDYCAVQIILEKETLKDISLKSLKCFDVFSYQISSLEIAASVLILSSVYALVLFAASESRAPSRNRPCL